METCCHGYIVCHLCSLGKKGGEKIVSVSSLSHFFPSHFSSPDLPAFPASLHTADMRGPRKRARALALRITSKDPPELSPPRGADVTARATMTAGALAYKWLLLRTQPRRARRRGFSRDDAGTLRFLFLNLFKCATPFRYGSLQLRLQTKTNKRAGVRGGVHAALAAAALL